ASGAPDKPIVITNGTDAGHNGTAILDEQNQRYNGVVLHNVNHVVVQNLSIQNITDSGFSVKSATGGVVIQNNRVYSGMGLGNGANARGYDVRNSVGANAVIVRNNSYSTPPATTSQADGIWSSGNNGVVFEGNSIVISNSNDYGHSDNIQSYQDMNITIRNNYFSHPNGGANNHGMWLSDARGTIAIYNNVVDMPRGDEQAITYWNETGYSGRALVWNNTVYGAYLCFRFVAAPGSELKNNICHAGQSGVVFENAAPPAANIDHNLIWAPTGNIAGINGSPKTWAEWQAYGFDLHGINAAPQFASANFSLASTSPAINRGTNLAQVTADFIGTARPQDGSYDIGAFESRLAPPNDSKSPSMPVNVTGIAASATQINLSWNASTDALGVVGYNVYSGGIKHATTVTPAFADTGLVPGMSYIYSIEAVDAAGNVSAKSASIKVTTPKAGQ
ncbi:MAG: choice-of-anchor Q domain-containing protein, partial [Bdellovibrionales bacterium]